jgi:polyisoprenoid-binding protein YceI
MATRSLGHDLAGAYLIDPAHSRLGFAVRHAMVTTVRGAFEDFVGRVEYDPSDPTGSVATVEIATASINTGNADRDAHLRSADFLDVEAHPTMSFTSTAIEVADHDSFHLVGDLTLRGTTRPVVVTASYDGTAVDATGTRRVGFHGSASISRRDFGMTFNAALETGGVMIGDKVAIEIDLSATSL